MPKQQLEVGVDPTRTVLLRSLRWWWLGAALALVIGILYFAAAGSAASEVTVERSVWFDTPPALVTGGNFVPETMDQAAHDPALPDSVTMRLADTHIAVTVSGPSDKVAADYDKALASLTRTYQGIVASKLTPLKAGAQRELDTATQRSEAVAATVSSAPPGSTEAIIGLTRMLALEDEAAKARSKVSEIDAQIANTGYMRARQLDEGSTTAHSRGAFDLLVGLTFGAVLGAVAMLACGSLLRRVGRTADLPQHKLIGVPLVNSTSGTLATDAIVIGGAIPAGATDTRTVVVSSDGGVPEVVMQAIRQRHPDASEIDASPGRIDADPLEFAAQIDNAIVVLVIRRGTSTAHAYRLIDIVDSRASQLVTVAVVPR